MVEALTGLGYGIIGFAILVGIGIVILASLGSGVSNCPTGFTYNQNGTGYVFAVDKCCNNTAGSCTGTVNSTNPSTATQTINTMNGYLGTSNGGLSTWIPITIVMTVGLMFLGWFLTKKGKEA